MDPSGTVVAKYEGGVRRFPVERLDHQGLGRHCGDPVAGSGTVGGARWRRWVPWVILAVVAVTVLVVGTHRTNGHPSVAAETMHIAALVRCPVCEGQSAAQSNAPASVQIRAQIQRELAAGENQAQILSGLVSAYGPGILEQPEARGSRPDRVGGSCRRGGGRRRRPGGGVRPVAAAAGLRHGQRRRPGPGRGGPWRVAFDSGSGRTRRR